MTTTKRKPDFKRQMYESEAWARSEVVCGVDEVGRSCLAGPVVAAAAILRPKAKHKLLKDSKVLTAQEREEAYAWLMKNCSFAVGITHHRLIDSRNIYQATLIAMKRAVVQLLAAAPKAPSLVLVDAMPVIIDHVDIPVVYFVYGEKQSASIAAASIIAKVTRDRLMERVSSVLPGYVFESNKGYGTQDHKKGIKEHGLTFMHRMSFIRTAEEEALFTASISDNLDGESTPKRSKKAQKGKKSKKKVTSKKRAATSKAVASKKAAGKKKIGKAKQTSIDESAELRVFAEEAAP